MLTLFQKEGERWRQRKMRAEGSHEGESYTGTPRREEEGAQPGDSKSSQIPLVLKLQEALRKSQRERRTLFQEIILF